MAQNQLTKEEIKELVARGYRDPVFFCRFFLPQLFSSDIPWVHRGLLAVLIRRCDFLLNDPELDKIIRNFVWEDKTGALHPVFFWCDGRLVMQLSQYTLVMMPRGYAKTTIGGIAVPLYNILYNIVKYTLYLSHAATHAQMQLDTVKDELSTNERILACFGPLRPEASADERWRQEMFETATGCAMSGSGMGGQVRGRLHKGQRPSRIICDDLEDREKVQTAEQRIKTLDWFMRDVMPALPPLDKEASITMLGTLLHQDALLAKLQGDEQWTVVKFGAIDRDSELLWAANMNHEELDKKKRSFARMGRLSGFYMEYFNLDMPSELRPFNAAMIHRSPPTALVASAVYLDPAVSSKRAADHSVITVAGMNERGMLWILEQWGKRGATPRELVDEFFRLQKQFACVHSGVEAIAYQAALIHIMREEMFRKGQWFEVVPVTHARRGGQAMKKEERIMLILQPRYANGYIQHARQFDELEEQLQDFNPNGNVHDDWIDSAAGVVALLDPHAGLALPEGADMGADVYPPLEEELGENYRTWTH